MQGTILRPSSEIFLFLEKKIVLVSYCCKKLTIFLLFLKNAYIDETTFKYSRGPMLSGFDMSIAKYIWF